MKPLRLLPIREVLTRTGLKRATLYVYVKRGWFPKPVRIGPNRVGWVESEVEGWIRARIGERDGEEAAA